MSIARTPDAKGTLRCRVSTQITDEQISVVIEGRSIVEAYTKTRLPRELSNFATDSHWKTRRLTKWDISSSFRTWTEHGLQSSFPCPPGDFYERPSVFAPISLRCSPISL
jgi:hypothetical protein